MALRISDEDYEKGAQLEDSYHNPNRSQADYEKTFNGKFDDLNKAEKSGNSETDKSLTDDNLKDAEESASGDWANNVSGKNSDNQGNNKGKAGGKFNFLKKKGPLTTIILTVVGGGIGIGGLLSPGLLIINFKEIMVSKFNTQLTAMDIRTNKMIYTKAMGVGICSSVINIRCKYTTMSDRQIANFKKAGIEVEYNPNESGLFGRKKPKGFMLEGSGRSVMAPGLLDELATNAKFRTAMKKGYNPLFAGFSDKFWNKAIVKLKISKKGITFEGKNDSEKLKNIQDETKNPAPNTGGIDESKRPQVDKDKPGGGKYSALDVENYDKSIASAKAIASEATAGAANVSKSGIKAMSTAISNSAIVTNTLKITGPMDNACLVYGTIRAVGFAAKTVRAIQLAKYAMLFLKMADQIKGGGNPNPEDVAYLGGILTADVISTIKTNGGVKMMAKKSATDSFGYKYAAYGEKGLMPDTAAQFLAGGGLTGQLINLSSVVNKILGGTPQITCKTLNNPFVQVGSGIIGIIGAIASGGISITWGAAISTVVVVGAIFLPALLKDIIAGILVDENTVGELAGDAITSGSSGMMGTVAATGGNAPLTVAQAVAYQNLSSNILAQYAEEDRLAYSPFDISNKNTFMGSIVSNLIPNISKISSLSGALTSLASIASSSLSLAFPTTKAADRSDFTMCQDEDYKNLGLASDPYCNLVYGIPTSDLNIDPLTVLDNMAGQIEDDGSAVAGSDYDNFIKECTDRTEPIGYTGSDFQGDSGSSCLINDSKPKNKYFYLYQIDQRVENGMDGSDEALNAAQEHGMNANISFYDSSLENYAVGSDQIDEIYASALTSDISIIEPENNEALNLPVATEQTNNNLKSVITNAQNTNICNPTNIGSRITDLSYLCIQPYFNKEYVGI